jgi:hypothetical protein
MRILLVTALALFSLATCQVQGVEPPMTTPPPTLPGGPVDTGGFLIYSPPTAAQPKRLAGAYWRQRQLGANDAVVREGVRRWTLRDVKGLDPAKVTTFNTSDPMLSESAGPYVLERVSTGNTLNDLLQAVADIAGVRPADDKSDTRFAFWGYTGELDKVPAVLVSTD